MIDKKNKNVENNKKEHICEQNAENGYIQPVRFVNGEWVVIDVDGFHDIGNISFCPFCGDKLE